VWQRAQRLHPETYLAIITKFRKQLEEV